ncbi:MAG: glutathione S-transferase [Pseudomonadota bacterium]
MLEIYHAPHTRSLRVIWLCAELNVPLRVIPVDFSAAYRSTPEWRALNPVGKVPVLRDGDITMFESGAMVEYILSRYGDGRLRPAPDAADYPLYLQWCWFAEATMARPLGELVNHAREFSGREIPEVRAEMIDRSVLSAEALGDAVADRDYLLGDSFSAADIMAGYSVRLVEMLIPERMPEQLAPYWSRLQQRPAYQQACAANEAD